MKKFKFPLDTLLGVRRERENIARKNLQEAHLYLESLGKHLHDLEEEQKNLLASIREAQQSSVHIKEIQEHFTYLSFLKAQIVEQHIALEKGRYQLEIQRKAVVKALKERKIIENLLERQFSEWEHNANEEEKRFFDELATIRFSHD